MAKAKLTDSDKVVVASLANLLTSEGKGNVRTGDRRSVPRARIIAQEAAKKADVEISVSDEDGYLYVEVK